MGNANGKAQLSQILLYLASGKEPHNIHKQELRWPDQGLETVTLAELWRLKWLLKKNGLHSWLHFSLPSASDFICSEPILLLSSGAPVNLNLGSTYWAMNMKVCSVPGASLRWSFCQIYILLRAEYNWPLWEFDGSHLGANMEGGKQEWAEKQEMDDYCMHIYSTWENEHSSQSNTINTLIAPGVLCFCQWKILNYLSGFINRLNMDTNQSWPRHLANSWLLTVQLNNVRYFPLFTQEEAWPIGSM